MLVGLGLGLQPKRRTSGAAAAPNLGVSISSSGSLTAGITGLLNAGALEDFTAGFWFRFDGMPLLTYGNAFEIWQAGGAYTAKTYVQLFTGTAGAEGTANRRLIGIDPGGGASHSVTPPSQDVWHYVTLTRWQSAANIWSMEEYIDAALDHTWVPPDTTWGITGPDQINLGFDGAGNGGVGSSPHSYRCLRIWKSRLTQPEIAAEMASKTPVKSSTLWRNWNLNGTSDMVDTVASAAMTGNGTFTTAAVGPF